MRIIRKLVNILYSKTEKFDWYMSFETMIVIGTPIEFCTLHFLPNCYQQILPHDEIRSFK